MVGLENVPMRLTAAGNSSFLAPFLERQVWSRYVMDKRQ